MRLSLCHGEVGRWCLAGAWKGCSLLLSSRELVWEGLCRGETESWEEGNLKREVGRQDCALRVMLGTTEQGTLLGRGVTWVL